MSLVMSRPPLSTLSFPHQNWLDEIGLLLEQISYLMFKYVKESGDAYGWEV